MPELLKKKLFNRRVLLLLGMGLFLVQLLFTFALTPTKASASNIARDWGLITDKSSRTFNWSADQITASWINAWTIEIAPTSNPEAKVFAIYVDDIRAQFRGPIIGRKYEVRGQEPCDATVTVDVANPAVLKLNLTFRPDTLDGCFDGRPATLPVNVDPNLASAVFRWVDSGKIEEITSPDDNNEYGSYTQSPDNPNIFVRDNESGHGACQDRILVYENGARMRFFELDDSFKGTPEVDIGTNCKYSDEAGRDIPNNAELALADIGNKDLPPGEGTGTGTTGADSAATATCEASGFSLSWIVCPVLNGILSGIDKIFVYFIDPFLRVSPISTNPNNKIFQAWSSFRTLGNVVLLFALLIAVFGQTIGGGLVDAYTIKKIMPRILVAAILINLSIYLCVFIVDVGNVLGRGIGQLITFPLGDDAIFNFKLGGLSDGVLGAGLIGALWGGTIPLLASFAGIGAVAGSIAGLGSLLIAAIGALLPILLIVLAIFVTLILRQGIILLLVLISPVALALWAIPSTAKYAKSWTNNFIKAVLVYPIVTAIFAISNVLAYMLLNTRVGDTSVARNAVADLAGIIVLIAPMAMIPFAFKLAGGLLGSLSSTISGSKGKIDTLVRGDKHNPHSRFYKRSDGTDRKGGVLSKWLGASGGIGGQGRHEIYEARSTKMRQSLRKRRGPVEKAGTESADAETTPPVTSGPVSPTGPVAGWTAPTGWAPPTHATPGPGSATGPVAGWTAPTGWAPPSSPGTDAPVAGAPTPTRPVATARPSEPLTYTPAGWAPPAPGSSSHGPGSPKPGSPTLPPAKPVKPFDKAA